MTISIGFTLTSQNIIHETIDDEVVIVDLEKGFYYSLRGTAAQIWMEIIAGVPEGDIIRILSDQYKTDLAKIEAPVKGFIHQLVEENIINPASPQDIGNKPDQNEPHLIYTSEQGEFSPPIIEKFTDMSELLLLDPIHEVDETGWPNMAPDNITDKEK